MNFRRVVSLVLVLFVMSLSVEAGELFRKKNKKGEKVEVKKESAYEKFFKGKKCETERGLFTVHKMDNKVYFELPLSLMGRDMLLGSTIAEISDNSFGCVGEKPHTPLHIQFTKKDSVVSLRYVSIGYITEDKNIQDRLDVSFVPAILRNFEVKTYNEDSTAVVIDMTDYLLSDDRTIDPFSPYAPILGYDGNLSRDFKKDNSQFEKVKAFSDNVSVQTTLSYTVSVSNSRGYYVYNMPFSAVMTRSFILLPEEPMRPRMADPRINIFFTEMATFANYGRGIQNTFYANRWRLEPKDMEAYKRGELVEPVKPIVFYIDDAFPESWKPYIRQAVEVWQKPFEAIGFKNAIIAKDFPKDDPEFDPENFKYSCVRYCPSWVENAMGPSWVDPRTGEILNANVSVYHNILNVVQAWRFIQTAPADDEVRTRVMREDILGDCLRYVVSHEVGHCLALMHNMASSAAIPTDSLRSPSFTQKYGTTPSIMDYARNNFVAQPGDYERGVRLTPPILGVYDIYAINWGYRLIPDAKTPKDEIPTLDKWIEEKKDDPMYTFGAQQFPGAYDPTDQTEDLGNDHFRAGEMAVSNLKIIMKNFEKWLFDEGKDFATIQEQYAAIVQQYNRHLRHVTPYIGGVLFKEVRQGENELPYTYLDKATQKKAMRWILNQVRTYRDWLMPADLMQRINAPTNYASSVHRYIPAYLVNPTVLFRIQEGGIIDPVKNYTLDSYLNDLIAEVFKTTYQGRKLNNIERDLQSETINQFIRYSSLKPASSGIRNLDFTDDIDLESEAFPCSHALCRHHDSEEQSFTRINMGPALSSADMAPYMTGALKKVLALYKQKRAATADSATRNFYDYQIITIEKLFNN